VLIQRAGDAAIDLEEKRAHLVQGELPPRDLPDDVKCALVAGLGLLGIFVGQPAASLIPAAITMMQMGCFDVLPE
jgi:hypothetical protein